MRRKQRKPVRTLILTAKGGPYDGKSLRLSDEGIASTAVFRVGRFCGRYVQGSHGAHVSKTVAVWMPQ